jgi:hypothetical protein
MEEAHKEEVGGVVSFHPLKPTLINFYEVIDSQGIAIWGGGSHSEAVTWLRRSPVNSRLLVSAWDSDLEDARIVGQPIDITKIVYSTLAEVL